MHEVTGTAAALSMPDSLEVVNRRLTFGLAPPVTIDLTDESPFGSPIPGAPEPVPINSPADQIPVNMPSGIETAYPFPSLKVALDAKRNHSVLEVNGLFTQFIYNYPSSL
jgi:hypothetical protein